jgi:mono/diheme cytochrome c family protein
MTRNRLVVLLALVGIGVAAPLAVAATLTAQRTAATGNAGKTLFKANCASCHTLKEAGASGTVGPNLDTLKLALAKVESQVTSGGRFMPPFGATAGGSLSAAEVKEVSEFVYGAEHGSVASGGSQPAAGAKLVKVTGGKPSELRFRLSTANVRLGTVTFTVINDGKLVHSFKVCSVPRARATSKTCSGKGTTRIKPHQTAKLTITFKKKGSYEYLSAVPGQAAAGMTGIVKVV